MSKFFMLVRFRFLSTISCKAFVASAAIMAILAAAPFFVQFPFLADYRYGSDTMRTRAEILSTQFADGVYETAPPELKDLLAEQLDAARAASRLPEQSREYFDEVERLDGAVLEQGKRGYLEGLSVEELEAQYLLTSALADMEHPRCYSDASEAPFLFYLAFIAGGLPQIVWFAPLFIALAIASRRFGHQAIDQGPQTRWFSALSISAAAVLSGIVLIAIAALVALALTAPSNGFGNPSYPTAYVQSGMATLSTVGSVLLRFVSYILICWITAAFAFAAALVTGMNRTIPIFVLFSLTLAPSIPYYSSEQAPWHELLSYLPSSHLVPSSYSGIATYLPSIDISLVENADFAFGAIALLAWGLATGAVCLIGSAVGLGSRWKHAKAETDERDRPDTSALHIRNLAISFRGRKIYDNAELTLNTGEVVALVAPNGSGKSTLLNALAGHAPRHSSYGMHMHGRTCRDDRVTRSSIYTAGSDYDALVPNASVKSQAKLISKLWDSDADVSRILEAFHLADIADQNAKSLSSGNYLLARLCLAWISEAGILLLDEPTSSLDPINTTAVQKLIAQRARQGASILVSTHDLDGVQAVCDAVVFISKKQLLRKSLEVNDGQQVRSEYEAMYQ